MLRSSPRTTPLFHIPRPPRQSKPGPNLRRIGPTVARCRFGPRCFRCDLCYNIERGWLTWELVDIESGDGGGGNDKDNKKAIDALAAIVKAGMMLRLCRRKNSFLNQNPIFKPFSTRRSTKAASWMAGCRRSRPRCECRIPQHAFMAAVAAQVGHGTAPTCRETRTRSWRCVTCRGSNISTARTMRRS